jgi:hypothetical protein
MGIAKSAALVQRNESSGSDRADEIDPREICREQLQPFVEELRTELLDDRDDDVVLIPTRATMGPRLDALVVSSWNIVGRELSGTIGQRLMHASQLLYLWVVSTASTPSSRADREELSDGLHELVFTWVFENRAELLTAREAQELRQYWAPFRQKRSPKRAANAASRTRARRAVAPRKRR